jgi:hypothetical protein
MVLASVQAFEAEIPVAIYIKNQAAFSKPSDTSAVSPALSEGADYPVAYVMARRSEYAPLTIKRVLDVYSSTGESPLSHIFKSANESLSPGTRPWLQTSQTSASGEITWRYMPWHIPLGVIFDILMSEGPPMLPWSLRLTFEEPPVDTPSLIPYPLTHGSPIDSALAAVGALHYSNVKQADYLRDGCGRGIQRLSKADQTAIWDSLVSGDTAAHFDAQTKLLSPQPDPASWRIVPIRLYVISDRENESSPVSWKVIQPPVSGAAKSTLSQLLDQYGLLGKSPFTRGLKVPLSTPISWLTTNLSYPDGFIHIVIS